MNQHGQVWTPFGMATIPTAPSMELDETSGQPAHVQHNPVATTYAPQQQVHQQQVQYEHDRVAQSQQARWYTIRQNNQQGRSGNFGGGASSRGPGDEAVHDKIRANRAKFERSFRYSKDRGRLWTALILIAGAATAFTSIGLSSYTTHIHLTLGQGIQGVDQVMLEKMPGIVFAISFAAFVGTALIQLASFQARKRLNARDKHPRPIPTLVETVGYLVAAGALALGYFCAQTALGTAMTLEMASIAGAITGAIISLPTVAIGPCRFTQGTMPHIVDILSSAIAGAVALGAAHILTEKFFIHMLGTAAVDPALTAVMQIAIAMPIFAFVKILCSIGYDGIHTAVAYGQLRQGQGGGYGGYTSLADDNASQEFGYTNTPTVQQTALLQPVYDQTYQYQQQFDSL